MREQMRKQAREKDPWKRAWKYREQNVVTQVRVSRHRITTLFSLHFHTLFHARFHTHFHTLVRACVFQAFYTH